MDCLAQGAVAVAVELVVGGVDDDVGRRRCADIALKGAHVHRRALRPGHAALVGGRRAVVAGAGDRVERRAAQIETVRPGIPAVVGQGTEQRGGAGDVIGQRASNGAAGGILDQVVVTGGEGTGAIRSLVTGAAVHIISHQGIRDRERTVLVVKATTIATIVGVAIGGVIGDGDIRQREHTPCIDAAAVLLGAVAANRAVNERKTSRISMTADAAAIGVSRVPAQRAADYGDNRSCLIVNATANVIGVVIENRCIRHRQAHAALSYPDPAARKCAIAAKDAVFYHNHCGGISCKHTAAIVVACVIAYYATLDKQRTVGEYPSAKVSSLIVMDCAADHAHTTSRLVVIYPGARVRKVTADCTVDKRQTARGAIVYTAAPRANWRSLIILDCAVCYRQGSVIVNPGAMRSVNCQVPATNCHIGQDDVRAAARHVKDAIGEGTGSGDNGRRRGHALNRKIATDVQVAGGVGVFALAGNGQGVGSGGDDDGVRAAAGGAAVHGCIGVG